MWQKINNTLNSFTSSDIGFYLKNCYQFLSHLDDLDSDFIFKPSSFNQIQATIEKEQDFFQESAFFSQLMSNNSVESFNLISWLYYCYDDKDDILRFLDNINIKQSLNVIDDSFINILNLLMIFYLLKLTSSSKLNEFIYHLMTQRHELSLNHLKILYSLANTLPSYCTILANTNYQMLSFYLHQYQNTLNYDNFYDEFIQGLHPDIEEKSRYLFLQHIMPTHQNIDKNELTTQHFSFLLKKIEKFFLYEAINKQLSINGLRIDDNLDNTPIKI